MASNQSGHAKTLRGLSAPIDASTAFGRFGKMFPKADACPARDEAVLAKLALVMIKADNGAPIIEDERIDENKLIPAGYTYFGQFVDHDITLDTTSLNTKITDPDALSDFRSPALDLDSIYGRGPGDQPYLYEKDGLRLRLGSPLTNGGAATGSPRDIQRLGDGVATLGDKRNDENKIVAQIHAAMIAFHNKVVMDDALIDSFGGDRSTNELRFQSAVTIVRWHYQWVVLHDYLKRICEPGIVDQILNAGGKPQISNYMSGFKGYPYIPVEFSVAAFRFGHSMVRPSYSLNFDVAAAAGADPTQKRIPTFSRDPNSNQNLNGFGEPIPKTWGIDWAFFLPDIAPRGAGYQFRLANGGFKDAVLPQPSYRIDALLAEPLQDLPEFFDPDKPAGSAGAIVGNLAFRNLLRGQNRGLPSGQTLAGAYQLEPLSDDIVWSAGSRVPLPGDMSKDEKDAFENGDNRRKAFRLEHVDSGDRRWVKHTPLWFYLLREAEYHGASSPEQEGAGFGGQHLGPLGSRIVAETLIALLWLDQSSVLQARPAFQPMQEIAGLGPLTLGKLISFALS